MTRKPPPEQQPTKGKETTQKNNSSLKRSRLLFQPASHHPLPGHVMPEMIHDPNKSQHHRMNCDPTKPQRSHQAMQILEVSFVPTIMTDD